MTVKNKAIKPFLFASALVGAVFGLTLNMVSAATILNDTFDYGKVGSAPSGWTKNSASNISVTVQPFPNEMNKSMRLYDNSNSALATASRSFPSQTAVNTYEFKFNTSDISAGFNFALRSGSNKVVDLLVGGAGQEFYYLNGSNNKVVLESNLAANTWYSVKVIADPASDKFSVSLNGVQKAADVPFKKTVSNLNSVYFATNGSTKQTLYIDDVNFYAGATATPTPTPVDGTIVYETIVVPSGTTFDGEGKRWIAGPPLGDGGQAEGQLPIFHLEPGANIKNVVLGAPAADGIHVYGDSIIENVVWEDIGEDALTVKAPGNVTVLGGSAQHGSDKVFQINAPSTFRVIGFRADDAGKLIRQNGGTTFKVDVIVDQSDISNMDEGIFRTDSNVSTVRFTNSRYHNLGELFSGVNPANIYVENNVEY